MNRPATPASLNCKAQFVPSVLLFAAFTLCASGAAAQTSAPRRIVVSFSDHKLALLEGGRVLKIYNVAVGAAGSPSPSGEFHIVQRLENPTYYKPGVMVGPGAENPLGPRWIGLNIKGFGIHGTNRPKSIGENASHGFIRLSNSDIKDLFARVQVGDRVSLIAERTEEVAQLFGETPSTAEAHEVLQAKNEGTVGHEIEQQGSR
jgi:lipoprotein-anchoring transpeptidase ErfK/SrfK